MQWFGNKKKKQQNAVAVAGRAKVPRYTKKSLSLAEFKNWSVQTKSVPLSSNILLDRAAFLKTYFSLVTRFIPTASQAVWTWRNLCSTRQDVKFEGGTPAQQKQAAIRVAALDRKMSPFTFSQGGGMDKLINLWFTNVFTGGRFAGNLVISPNMDEVAGFDRVDPFLIKFEKETLKPYLMDEKNPSMGTPQNEATFYYYGINMDDGNPYGTAFIEAADSFMQIANDMMSDMAASASNAGVPRLHFKIKQPAIMEGEDPANYTTRANSYFDETIDEMSDLAPDDNIYSWADVEVGIAGGTSSPTAFVWATNRQVVDEEIIAAFHLYPWVVGKSASTTKNWVTSQFDLLMQQSEAFQREVKRFSEWIANTDLMLAGLGDVRVVRTFSQPRDPAAKDQAIAQRFRIANVKSKVLMGTIDPDTGARELGYDKAYNPNLIYRTNKIKEEPINKAYKPNLIYRTNKIKEEPINKEDKADRQPPVEE